MCLCTYNGERYIHQQLQSIIDQTLQVYEIIVVDDCSTDNTIEIVKSFCHDPRIKLFRNQTTLGYVKNFEKAISLSSGNYIALSDQDDIWYPDKIQELVMGIKDHLLIYHNSLYMDKNGNSLNRDLFDRNKYLNGQKSLAFVFGSCITGHTMMFRKELLQFIFPFPKTFPHDWWIGYVASCEGSIYYLDKILTGYRVHDNNVIAGKTVEMSKLGKLRKMLQGNFERLEILKNYKNISERNKIVLEQLIQGYREKQNNFFSLKLFKTLLHHKKELLALKRGGELKKLHFVFKEALGDKWKKL